MAKTSSPQKTSGKKTTTKAQKASENKTQTASSKTTTTNSSQTDSAETLEPTAEELTQLMEWIAKKSDFTHHLSLVARAVPSKPSHPVLAHTLIEANEQTQQIHLHTTNLCSSITTVFDAQVKKGGAMTVPLELLSNVCNKFEDSIKLCGFSQTSSKSAVIAKISDKEAHACYELQGMSAEEFPATSAVNAPAIQFPTQTLQVAIRGVLFAASDNEAKQIITGVHLKLAENLLKVTATNGNCIAIVEVPLQPQMQPDDESNINEVVIPAKALKDLIFILRDSTEIVFRHAGENHQSLFECNRQKFTTRSLEGMFPDCEALIAKFSFPRSIALEKVALVKALERLSTLTDKKEPIVVMNVFEDKLVFSIQRNSNKGQEVVPIAAQTNPTSTTTLSILLNVSYLLTAVKAIESSDIKIGINQSATPILIEPAGKPANPELALSAKYLIAPLVSN